MNQSDEDFFGNSDDEIEVIEKVSTRNPVEEHLLRQRDDVLDRVEKAKSNVGEVKGLAECIVRKLHVKATCGQSSGSDTDSDVNICINANEHA